MSFKGIGTTMYQWDKEYQKKGLVFDDNLEQAHKEMNETGLDGVETRLKYADTEGKASNFKKVCKENNLKIASLYGSCKLYDKSVVQEELDNFLYSVTSARKTGCSLITLNMATPENRDKTDEELKVQVESLNRLGEEVDKLDMKIAIHNHTPEMKDNAREFRFIMNNLATDAIGACLDIAWTVMADVSPVELIDEYHNRLYDIHLRNIDNYKFTQAVTEGSIPYSQIIKLLRKYNYEGWLIVELAYTDQVVVTRNFKENIIRSIWYLKGLTDYLETSS